MKYLKKITLIFILLLSTQGYSQKKLAILPFTFSDNGHISVQEGKEAQQFLIGYINKKHKHFNVTVMNGRDVNVKLHKAGITADTMDDFTTSEIAEAVGADYILIGSIDKVLQGGWKFVVNVAIEVVMQRITKIYLIDFVKKYRCIFDLFTSAITQKVTIIECWIDSWKLDNDIEIFNFGLIVA